jgi:hypothetical protein
MSSRHLDTLDVFFGNIIITLSSGRVSINLMVMKNLSSPRKMKASCGSDAYVATSANIFSRDVGVAPTKCVRDFGMLTK